MTIRRVKSTGDGTNNGDTWAHAYPTLVAGLTACAAGDTIWLSNNQNELGAAATDMTLQASTNPALPIIILCVDDSADPATALATTAVIATQTTGRMIFKGYAHSRGVTYLSGTGVTGADMAFELSGTALGWTIEDGEIGLGHSADKRIIIGAGAASAFDHWVKLINTKVKFGAVAQKIAVKGRLFWTGTAAAIDGAGSSPTTLFVPAATDAGFVDMEGVDLQALSGNFVTAATAGCRLQIRGHNLRFHASTTIIASTIAGFAQIEVDLDDCGAKSGRYRYHGSTVPEATLVKTGGASDGTSGVSLKMVSLAGASYSFPLVSPAITRNWQADSGVSKTVTVDILHDSLTNLTENDVWLEVMYRDSGTYPSMTTVTDRGSILNGSPADQTDSTATWTTTGMTNPNTQKLSVTFTPAAKGNMIARVVLAKPSTTVYVDPVIQVS